MENKYLQWYPYWKEYKKQLMTADVSFDSEEEFKKRLQTSYNQFDTIDRKKRQVSIPLTKVGQIGNIFRKEEGTHFYAREGSFAEDNLCRLLVQAEAGYVEQGLNPLEKITASVFPSGMAAISGVMFGLAMLVPNKERIGKRFLVAENEDIYSDTNFILYEQMVSLGFDTAQRINLRDENHLAQVLACNPGNIMGIFYEPLPSPLLNYINTRKIQEIAQHYDVPIIVDNTLLSPYLQQQFRLGADIIIESMTKYMSSEGDYMGGAVIGPKGFIDWLRLIQKVNGNVMQSPIIADMFAERLLHLPENMKIYTRNAAEVSNYLQSCSSVEKVYYPDLREETRSGSAGGILSFLLKGNSEDDKKAREIQLLEYVIKQEATSQGDADFQYKVSFGEQNTLFFGESTHGALTKAPAGLIRLAVGKNQNGKQIIEFLEKAFTFVYEK